MSRLLKNVSIYFIGNAVNRLMGLVVTSIATYVLTNRSDFGYFQTSSNMINIIMTLVCVQAWMAIIRFVFDYELPKQKLKVIATGYFIEFISFTIYTIGFITFSLIFPIRDAFELYLLSFGYVFNQGVQFACRGLGKNKLYVISGIVGSVAQLVSYIIFMFAFNMTSNALILAMAMSYISQGLFIEIFLKSFRHFKLSNVNLKLAKKMLFYCIPTALNNTAYSINTMAHVIIIGFFMSNDEAGLLGAANKMNSLIGIIIMAFNFAFQEYSFAMSKSDLREKMYNKMFNAFVRFMSCGMMLLLPITYILFSIIIGPSYGSARVLVPLLYIGSFLESLHSFLGSVMQAEKKVNLMFMSQLIGVFVTIATFFITIPFVGLQSSGIATITCFLIVSLIRIYGLRPNITLKFNMTYFIHYTIILGVTIFIYLNFNELINLIYCVLLSVYAAICNKNLIKELTSSLLKRRT